MEPTRTQKKMLSALHVQPINYFEVLKVLDDYAQPMRKDTVPKTSAQSRGHSRNKNGRVSKLRLVPCEISGRFQMFMAASRFSASGCAWSMAFMYHFTASRSSCATPRPNLYLRGSKRHHRCQCSVN